MRFATILAFGTAACLGTFFQLGTAVFCAFFVVGLAFQIAITVFLRETLDNIRLKGRELDQNDDFYEAIEVGSSNYAGLKALDKLLRLGFWLHPLLVLTSIFAALLA